MRKPSTTRAGTAKYRYTVPLRKTRSSVAWSEYVIVATRDELRTYVWSARRLGRFNTRRMRCNTRTKCATVQGKGDGAGRRKAIGPYDTLEGGVAPGVAPQRCRVDNFCGEWFRKRAT